MARNLIAALKPRESTTPVDKSVNRGKMLAGKIGRAIALGGASLLLTPTARLAHSQLGQDIRDIMGSASPRPAAVHVTKITVMEVTPIDPMLEEQLREHGSDVMRIEANDYPNTEGVE